MKRLRHLKKSADEEKARLMNGQKQREHDRIRREVEEQEKKRSRKEASRN
jgi:translation initiation factor 3 subunit A